MTAGGGTGEAQWKRSAGFLLSPTVAFVVIHWWLWEPPSLCKSVFATQVFVCAMCSRAQESVFSFPCIGFFVKSEAKGQSCIKAGITLAINLLIKGLLFLYQ